MAVLTNHFQISKNNNHLIDIFNEDCYLELGNLNTNALSKLLKHKLVRYSDLAYFAIQNKGIGTSDIKNIKLKEKIPYFYFENFTHKDADKKLFITYGIIVQRRGYKENFTPIILLPVDIMVDDSDIWFQMSGSPIENPYLPYRGRIDLVKDRNIDIYDIDNYCLDAFRQDRHNIRLESYLTFANVTIPNAVFSNEKFNVDGVDVNEVESGFNLNAEANVCNVTSLNHTQRICLEMAAYGKSFAISGILGTGKTTTLMNIACNAIHDNKKVLYISNNEETLDELQEKFKKMNLESMMINLVNLSIRKNEKYQFSIPADKGDTFVRQELETKYDGVKEYTKTLYDKINGFRYLDIVKGLIEYKDADNDLNKDILDGIQHVYRLEAEEIEKALANIDENLSKIKSFKDSKYNNVPIKNQSSVEEITHLVQGLRDYYLELIEDKETLEKDFGFSPIPNYAYFRNIINNYFMLDKSLVPPSWLEYTMTDCKKKRLKKYDEAQNAFDEFSLELADAAEKEEALKQDYNTEELDDIDIHHSINLILSKFEKQTSAEINNFLKNNKILLDKINNIKEVMEECEYNFGKMRDKIGVKVNYRDTEAINQIVPFIQFFEENRIPKTWLDTKNSEGIRKRIVSIKHQLEKYENLIDTYNNYFTDINNIDNNINFLLKKKEKNNTYHNVPIDELIYDLKKLKEMDVNIEDAYKQFYSLTLEEFPGNDVLKRFDRFNELIKNISDERIQNKLVKNLSTLRDARLEEFIRPFILFSSSYTSIMNLYDELKTYYLVDEAKNLPDKMNKILSIGAYCEQIYNIQLKMNKIIKRDLAYVPYQEYLVLADKIENLVTIRTKIDKNKTYQVLYGPLFKGYLSSAKEIEEVIYNFGQYVNIFIDNDAVKMSLNKDTSKALDKILKESFAICESVSELIKDYSKTFRDGTGKYYYDNLDSIISHDAELLKDIGELKIYLKVTRGLQVLLQHKLYNLNEYIINHDKEVFKDRFMIAYYTYLYKEFSKKNPIVRNGEGFYKLIDDIISLEDTVCSKNIDDLILHHLPHTPIPAFKGKNFDKYFRKINESKSLYLANTKVLNDYLDPSVFDLVLIDDANLSESDVYTKALSCNQVIVSGINNIRVGIYNDILTKIKNNAIIELKKRYVTTPMDLVEHIERAKTNFYENIDDNKGIIISCDEMVNLIISLITQDLSWDESFRVKLNKDIKINCFVRSFEKTRRLFDEIASNLAELNISLEDIYYVIRKQVNVSDLHNAYLWNADYNIIDIDDYNEDNDIYENKNLISNLVCVKKKLYIIDQNDLLGSDEGLGFVKEVKTLLENKDIIYPITDKTCLKIAQSLARHKIHVLGVYRNFDIVVEKNNKYFGLMIFNSPSNYGNDILNSYRDQVFSPFPFKVIYVNDLIENYNECINSIVKEVNHE